MKFTFWLSALFILLAYAGYPAWLYFRAKFWPCPVQRAPIFPSVTILLAVRNEQKRLSAKLRNVAALDYPADRLEVIVVSDGSVDGSNEILAAWKGPKRRTVILPDHQGKAAALNRGMSEAQGDIVVFTDARQVIAPDALKNLVENFADASVGCVSGELMIAENSAGVSSQGVALYWKVEKKIRYWEALVGSTVGATGAFYATRRNLVVPVPNGTILDDVYIPLQVVRQGFRVVFQPQAIATDDPAPSLGNEFRRKVRTLAGNYQLLKLLPWLVTRTNPVRFEFICHKLLRLAVPFALLGLFVSSALLHGPIYQLALVLQLIFAGLAVIAVLPQKMGFVSRLADVSLAFLLLNTAAVVALFCFLSGRKVWGLAVPRFQQEATRVG
jgi:cellulose synthase/poly-beta-1,6-N-acetylglucosamine synthase-like glycosyltransferase